MKSSLDKIEDALKKKSCNLLPLTLRTSQIQDLSEGTQNREQFFYQKSAFFVEKISKKNKVLEKLVKCVDE